jgi:uncharacterized protein (TIGR04255 family)
MLIKSGTGVRGAPRIVWQGEDVDRALKNAPLREAVFELFADPEATTTWSAAAPEHVRAQFPEYGYHEEAIQEVGLQFQMGPDGPVTKQYAPRARFRRWDAEKKTAIQFGAYMCAYNILGAGYTQFENHVAMIARVLRCYVDEAQPTKIAWVGQRYINAVKLPRADVDVASYFSIYPTLPTSAGHRPFALQVQMAETKNCTVIVNLALEQADDDEATYTLDIYARSVGEVPIDIDALKTWHVSTHEVVRSVFAHTTTERLRGMPKGET